jgi:hydroxymethylbilane synthase
MNGDLRLRIATRGSLLARRQADLALGALRAAHPSLRLEVVVVATTGDRDRRTPLGDLAGRGVFVDGLRKAVLAGQADAAVHSLKDVPTASVDGLTLAAVLERGDARDAFVGAAGLRLRELAPGAKVGTSSTRRLAQVAAARPDLVVVPLRGNVDTRLAKVADGEMNGAVLAAAGLERLGRLGGAELLDPAEFVPAPGQGAIALECRASDAETVGVLAVIDHATTRAAVTAERAFLGAQGRNCSLPVGAYAIAVDGRLDLRGTLAGTPAAAKTVSGPIEGAWELGDSLGREMRAALEASS